jgi:hypothetical protein
LLFWFFGGTGVWTQGFWIAKQALYCLSHTSSPKVFKHKYTDGLREKWKDMSCK